MFQLFFVALLFISHASGQVINLGTDAEETNSYLESGFITLSGTDRVVVSTANTFTNPVVFLSTVFSASAYSDSIPVQARVKRLVDQGGVAGKAQFSVRLVWPSNETCVSQWADGSEPQGSYSVGWYVGESGAYSVAGIQMEFTTATVTVNQWSGATWPHPFGTCNYPAQSGDDAYSPGAIFTLQSNNNNLQYLTVRSSNWFKSSSNQCNYAWTEGRLRLYPHDSADVSLVQDETVGVFLFDTRFPETLDCVGGSYLEIGQVTDLASDPYGLSLFVPVDTSSTHLGVFGSALSLEGGDAMVIKSYTLETNTQNVYTFMQEDQCADEEIIHNPEVFSYLLNTPTTTTDCDPTAPIRGDHTYAPSRLPTPAPVSSSSASTGKSEDVLLAVFLPIGIILVVIIVGFVTKKVYLDTPPKDDSEHSGLNLMP